LSHDERGNGLEKAHSGNREQKKTIAVVVRQLGAKTLAVVHSLPGRHQVSSLLCVPVHNKLSLQTVPTTALSTHRQRSHHASSCQRLPTLQITIAGHHVIRDVSITSAWYPQVNYPAPSGDTTTLPALGTDLVNNGLNTSLGSTTVSNISSSYGVNLASTYSLTFAWSTAQVSCFACLEGSEGSATPVTVMKMW
jgi:hypothetical protein